MSETHLIVGLGNPGEEYAGTRHNAGFEAVDAIARELGVTYWKAECGALTAKAAHGGAQLVLAKPQSFMNASGGPVKRLLASYGIAPAQMVVIHDELDLPAGTIRAKLGGGHAGHNGLRSICDKLGTRDWHRVRVGIGRPPGRMAVTDWVLSAPRRDDAEAFQADAARAAEAALCLVTEGLERTQQRYN